jgi:hypothetical protein
MFRELMIDDVSRVIGVPEIKISFVTHRFFLPFDTPFSETIPLALANVWHLLVSLALRITHRKKNQHPTRDLSPKSDPSNLVGSSEMKGHRHDSPITMDQMHKILDE